MPSTLWLLPVGLGDRPWEHWLPAEAQAVACSLKYFIVENAKTARADLKRLGHPVALRELLIEQIPEPLTLPACDKLLEPLAAGHDIGLMSEAGCPAIADPGALLVRRAHELRIKVRPLVGPSSIVLALMGSGLDGQRFAFHGYLPAREPERSKRISTLEFESTREQQTQIFIETPYRNAVMFDALLRSCKPRTRLCIATDLTLESELIQTLSIAEWRSKPPPVIDKRPTVFLFLG